jgi:predicted nuclease of predicted toxin-antitoxin system
MRFLIGAMLPRELVKTIRDFGYEVRHVRKLGLSGLSDEGIWNVACDNGEIIITKDEDFANFRKSDPRVRVILYRRGNTKFAELIKDFETSMPDVIARLENGEQMIEIS